MSDVDRLFRWMEEERARNPSGRNLEMVETPGGSRRGYMIVLRMLGLESTREHDLEGMYIVGVLAKLENDGAIVPDPEVEGNYLLANREAYLRNVQRVRASWAQRVLSRSGL